MPNLMMVMGVALVISRPAAGTDGGWRVERRPFALVLFYVACGYFWIQAARRRFLQCASRSAQLRARLILVMENSVARIYVLMNALSFR